MAINVNDGTAKWQLIKYSEADTLGGLTADNIKSQAINGKVVQVKGQSGSITLSTQGSRTYTIPVPSGYSRNQCAYIISEEYDQNSSGEGTNRASIGVNWSSVNQSNGVITATVNGKYPNSYYASINVDYIIVAAK